MAERLIDGSRDWLRSPGSKVLAWWIPQVAILLADVGIWHLADMPTDSPDVGVRG
jgi:hypothetical protein